jgi:predicted lipoprotein with Yx(FWY)xxD motif
MQYGFNKITLLKFMGLLAACLILAGNTTAGTTNDETGIKVMQKEELGRYLAAGNGMTLYAYSRDGNNFSNCVEGCAYNWPPYYAGLSSPGEGFEEGVLETITREDGRKQTTFKGMPLYRFIKDKYPGDTFGNGLGGVWSIVKQ